LKPAEEIKRLFEATGEAGTPYEFRRVDFCTQRICLRKPMKQNGTPVSGHASMNTNPGPCVRTLRNAASVERTVCNDSGGHAQIETLEETEIARMKISLSELFPIMENRLSTLSLYEPHHIVGATRISGAKIVK